MKKSKTWIIPVESLSGTDDVFVTLPKALIKKLKWKEGDEITFEVVEGGYSLRKVTNTK
jgi:hypothetical protein